MAIPVIMPRQGQSVETCIIGEWYNKKGDHVEVGDIILSYETDKASFDLESPATGVILEIFYRSGEEVKVLTNIAVIGQPGEPVDAFMPEKTSATAGSSIGVTASEASAQLSDVQKTGEQIIETVNGIDKIKISPRARNLASKLNIPVSQIKGTGPMGKINEIDVENAAASLQATSLAENTDKQGYSIKKISNIRRIIAENMHSSLKNAAQLTHHTSANAKKILEYRKIFKDDPEKAKAENITINDMVCYAVIKALKIKPEINCHFLGDSFKIFSKVHLGIAVDTERGLMVPALKNADDYSLPELSRALKSLADRCRKGNVDPELLEGDAASFTVSNLGFYGVEMFTPVLNLPQAGILGINTIINRPDVLSDGSIGSVPVIGLSLTYDHRAIDGAPASAFLKEVKDQIEMFDLNEI
ncbi:MAG: 2-oxo acid dehydrogenase subunit E2 [Bacteroidales bacterium]|nr:2-oxo acid dehydrogenase subunit E2 [Bacteroidales bacterium]